MCYFSYNNVKENVFFQLNFIGINVKITVLKHLNYLVSILKFFILFFKKELKLKTAPALSEKGVRKKSNAKDMLNALVKATLRHNGRGGAPPYQTDSKSL